MRLCGVRARKRTVASLFALGTIFTGLLQFTSLNMDDSEANPRDTHRHLVPRGTMRVRVDDEWEEQMMARVLKPPEENNNIHKNFLDELDPNDEDYMYSVRKAEGKRAVKFEPIAKPRRKKYEGGLVRDGGVGGGNYPIPDGKLSSWKLDSGKLASDGQAPGEHEAYSQDVDYSYPGEFEKHYEAHGNNFGDDLDRKATLKENMLPNRDIGKNVESPVQKDPAAKKRNSPLGIDGKVHSKQPRAPGRANRGPDVPKNIETIQRHKAPPLLVETRNKNNVKQRNKQERLSNKESGPARSRDEQNRARSPNEELKYVGEHKGSIVRKEKDRLIPRDAVQGDDVMQWKNRKDVAPAMNLQNTPLMNKYRHEGTAVQEPMQERKRRKERNFERGTTGAPQWLARDEGLLRRRNFDQQQVGQVVPENYLGNIGQVMQPQPVGHKKVGQSIIQEQKVQKTGQRPMGDLDRQHEPTIRRKEQVQMGQNIRKLEPRIPKGHIRNDLDEETHERRDPERRSLRDRNPSNQNDRLRQEDLGKKQQLGQNIRKQEPEVLDQNRQRLRNRENVPRQNAERTGENIRVQERERFDPQERENFNPNVPHQEVQRSAARKDPIRAKKQVKAEEEEKREKRDLQQVVQAGAPAAQKEDSHTDELDARLKEFEVRFMKKLKENRCTRFRKGEYIDRTRDIQQDVLALKTRPRSDDITLMTHINYNQTGQFLFLLRLWKGPVSVAIYVDKTRYLGYVRGLRRDKQITERANVDIHVVRSRGEGYPTSFLQAVALDGVKTDYTFVTDPHLMLHADVYSRMRNTVRRSPIQHKQVLVVPAFDVKIEDSRLLQHTKADILPMLQRGDVEPFQIDLFPPAHLPTRYDKWIDASSPYDVTYFEGYAPYYVARTKDLPRFNGNVTGEFRVRSAHTFLLYQLGFRFTIVPDSFLVHDDHDVHTHGDAVDPNFQRCSLQVKKMFHKSYLSKVLRKAMVVKLEKVLRRRNEM